jgi:hypothetical protein
MQTENCAKIFRNKGDFSFLSRENHKIKKKVNSIFVFFIFRSVAGTERTPSKNNNKKIQVMFFFLSCVVDPVFLYTSPTFFMTIHFYFSCFFFVFSSVLLFFWFRCFYILRLVQSAPVLYHVVSDSVIISPFYLNFQILVFLFSSVPTSDGTGEKTPMRLFQQFLFLFVLLHN